MACAILRTGGRSCFILSSATLRHGARYRDNQIAFSYASDKARLSKVGKYPGFHTS